MVECECASSGLSDVVRLYTLSIADVFSRCDRAQPRGATLSRGPRQGPVYAVNGVYSWNQFSLFTVSRKHPTAPFTSFTSRGIGCASVREEPPTFRGRCSSSG